MHDHLSAVNLSVTETTTTNFSTSIPAFCSFQRLQSTNLEGNASPLTPVTMEV